MNATHEPRRTHGGRLVAGVILIGLGVFFLLFNLDLVEIDPPWQWWPLLLVAIGAGRLLTADDHDERRGGTWLILLGGWLLINSLGLFGLSWHDSWPLLIMAAGGMMVWRSIATESTRTRAGEAGGEGR